MKTLVGGAKHHLITEDIGSAAPAIGFGFNALQLCLLFILLGVGTPILALTIMDGSLITILLFFFITILGIWLCYRTCAELADQKLKILITFWLLKVIMTVFLLYAGWIPQLDPSSGSWGYDPQRYFQDAWTLVLDGWEPVVGSNYQGIIFFYGAVFYLFGHNPVIPALINALFTLMGLLFLIRYAYGIFSTRLEMDWTIAFLLIVPEILWYDVMTGRETIMATLIVFATLSIGRYLFNPRSISFISMLLVSGSAFFAILAIRTSMIIPVLVSVGMMVMLLHGRWKVNLLSKMLIFSLAVALLPMGSHIQRLTGGYDMNWFKIFDSLLSFENNVAFQMTWSENSIGLILTPNNIWQAILYLPIRMIGYLVAPLPNFPFSTYGLVNGHWSDWQAIMTIPTSIMMLLSLPFALAAASQAWRFRKHEPALLVPHIILWVTFMAVAGGNIIIHERYRIMFTTLFFLCVWIGYTRSARIKVIKWALIWFTLLAAGVIFYITYKLIG